MPRTDSPDVNDKRITTTRIKIGRITVLNFALTLNYNTEAEVKTSRSPRPNLLWIMHED